MGFIKCVYYFVVDYVCVFDSRPPIFEPSVGRCLFLSLASRQRESEPAADGDAAAAWSRREALAASGSS